MALLQIDFFSESLMRTVTMNAIIPTDKTLFTQHEKREIKEYKALYLLHGGYGNYTDWLGGTRVQAWAQDKDLAVFMPSGDNKFYIDNPDSGEMYGSFIGKELIEFTRKTFPLSQKREDTFIAGLSMGGYGALVNGRKYNETFGAIGGFSSGLLLEGVVSGSKKFAGMMPGNKFYESIFGDLAKVLGSEKDYKALAEGLVREKKTLPKLFLACGTEDFLLPEHREFRQFLTDLGYPFTYEEGPGGHEWAFWDTYIKKFIDWLPLGEAVQGISSGHVME